MFSKSKRFPEAGRDYIPGPGEYEVFVEDSSKHKRYGFLTQTNRFSESPDPSMSSEFYVNHHHHHHHHHNNNHNHNDESTTTSLSISSTTSSNKTSDENASRSTSRKASTSPTDTINPFEKYRYAMQKEIESLQTKTRKMDSTIQTLETEKNDTKALLLDRDLELADLRSKNALLQKTIQRQEKSSKNAQLQKKIEQLEETLQNSQTEHLKKEQALEMMRQEMEAHKQSVCDLQEAQKSSQEKHTLLEAHINSLTAQLSESQTTAAQKDMQISELEQQVDCMTHTISSLEQQLEAQAAESSHLEQRNNNLMIQLQEQQELIQQLDSRLVLKEEETDALLNTIDERDIALQDNASAIEALDQRFSSYRDYVDTTIVPHLRGQAKTMEQLHINELNELLTELHQAKRFMNKQAQSMDLLKSNVHWLNVQNTQLKTLIHSMHSEHKQQWKINKKYHQSHTKRTHQEEQDDDAISFSSKSTVSNYQDKLSNNPDSSIIALNDSGFGMLTE